MEKVVLEEEVQVEGEEFPVIEEEVGKVGPALLP